MSFRSAALFGAGMLSVFSVTVVHAVYTGPMPGEAWGPSCECQEVDSAGGFVTKAYAGPMSAGDCKNKENGTTVLLCKLGSEFVPAYSTSSDSSSSQISLNNSSAPSDKVSCLCTIYEHKEFSETYSATGPDDATLKCFQYAKTKETSLQEYFTNGVRLIKYDYYDTSGGIAGYMAIKCKATFEVSRKVDVKRYPNQTDDYACHIFEISKVTLNNNPTFDKCKSINS